MILKVCSLKKSPSAENAPFWLDGQKASSRVKACLGIFCSLRAPHGAGDGLSLSVDAVEADVYPLTF